MHLFPIKINNWVEPSFGELLGGVSRTLKKGPLSGESKATSWSSNGNPAEKKIRKRKVDPYVSDNQNSVSSEASNQDEPWVDIHAPQSQVHKLVLTSRVLSAAFVNLPFCSSVPNSFYLTLSCKDKLNITSLDVFECVLLKLYKI